MAVSESSPLPSIPDLYWIVQMNADGTWLIQSCEDASRLSISLDESWNEMFKPRRLLTYRNGVIVTLSSMEFDPATGRTLAGSRSGA